MLWKRRAAILLKSFDANHHGFAFDDAVAEDDTLTVTEGVTLVVDAMSLQYLMGARVDFEDGLAGSRFVIHNPNAQTTCGCGSSFSV